MTSSSESPFMYAAVIQEEVSISLSRSCIISLTTVLISLSLSDALVQLLLDELDGLGLVHMDDLHHLALLQAVGLGQVLEHAYLAGLDYLVADIHYRR